MLEAEKIKENWERYREIVNTCFPTRKDALNSMYDELEERMVFMPASSMEHFHNAFAGGYVDHILRVIECTEALYFTWSSQGADMSGYTNEEMLFAAMHHDLGKAGFPTPGGEIYIPNDSEWHRKNQGKMYKHNPANPFTMVPDLSLWNLQHFGILVSWNEYLGIRIHDGLYDDANKPYYIARSADAKMRNNLALILHHADHMAARIEYERWANGSAAIAKPIASKPKATTKSDLSAIDASKLFNDLFRD